MAVVLHLRGCAVALCLRGDELFLEGIEVTFLGGVLISQIYVEILVGVAHTEGKTVGAIPVGVVGRG